MYEFITRSVNVNYIPLFHAAINSNGPKLMHAQNGYTFSVIQTKTKLTKTNWIALIKYCKQKRNCEILIGYRLEMGQVFFCDCILSILLLCSINIICLVYLLHTCVDCHRYWFYNLLSGLRLIEAYHRSFSYEQKSRHPIRIQNHGFHILYVFTIFSPT